MGWVHLRRNRRGWRYMDLPHIIPFFNVIKKLKLRMVSEVRLVWKIISLEIVLQVSTYVADLLVILHLTQKHPIYPDKYSIDPVLVCIWIVVAASFESLLLLYDGLFCSCNEHFVLILILVWVIYSFSWSCNYFSRTVQGDSCDTVNVSISLLVTSGVFFCWCQLLAWNCVEDNRVIGLLFAGSNPAVVTSRG